MANNSGKSRFLVNLSCDMIERLDAYAKALGMSRSGLCAYFIGQGVYGLDKASHFADQAGSALVSEIMKSDADKRGEIAAQ